MTIKEALEKLASGSPAPKGSLAQRESRRNRQGFHVGRQTAKQSIQAAHQTGDSSMGSLSKGSTVNGAKYQWNPIPKRLSQSQGPISKDLLR